MEKEYVPIVEFDINKFGYANAIKNMCIKHNFWTYSVCNLLRIDLTIDEQLKYFRKETDTCIHDDVLLQVWNDDLFIQNRNKLDFYFEYKCFMFIEKSELLGFVLFENDLINYNCCIFYLLVDKKHRNKGIGKKLINEVIINHTMKGLITPIRVDTNIPNYFAKLGFVYDHDGEDDRVFMIKH